MRTALHDIVHELALGMFDDGLPDDGHRRTRRWPLLLALGAGLLAACDDPPPPPPGIPAMGIRVDSPIAPDIHEVHLDERRVTCWLTARGGISCLPDAVLGGRGT